MTNKTINVLSLVSYRFLPAYIGGQKNIALFNRYLSKCTNLYCVTTKENTPSQAEGYPVMNILSNSTFRYINPLYFFTLSRIIRENKITHLIIEHPYYGWLGILLKWYCKIKLIVHSHNIEGLRFKSLGKSWWGILWQYEKFVHQNADHNFFIQDNDRNYAIENFKLSPQKSTIITYGVESNAAPSQADKQLAKEQICKIHQLHVTDKILLFNGALGYMPNLNALNVILEKINPLLLAQKNFTYRIIICGSNLPAVYNGLIDYKEKNILYAGFVDDINLYFKGADIFINPVIEGGGIKTKLVEALGYDLSVVSTQTGAIGIPVEITGKKLFIANDNNWENFTDHILSANPKEQIPDEFFRYFYWGILAEKAFEAIKCINTR
jgi:hypothetical protein